jgi:transposase
MGRKKMSDAARIRAYFAKNPGAKPAEAVKALGVSAANVYVVRKKMKDERGGPRVEPTEKANAWLDANPWFGKDAKATAVAVAIHEYILKQGVVADSDEYYKLLDKHMQQAAAAQTALAEEDMVNHPPHYKSGGIETIDFIEAKELNYRLGNVIKYITRADHKGDRLEDLKKAMWYLQREIDKV